MAESGINSITTHHEMLNKLQKLQNENDAESASRVLVLFMSTTAWKGTISGKGTSIS